MKTKLREEFESFLVKDNFKYYPDPRKIEGKKIKKFGVFYINEFGFVLLLDGIKVKKTIRNGKKKTVKVEEKIFNQDKTICLTRKEIEFLYEFPKTKVAFYLAGFWFVSDIVLKEDDKGNVTGVVEYKEPFENHKKADKEIEFVHLHNHFEYSQLDGCFDAGKWIDRCKEVGFKALALTDHGSLAGIMDFYLTAKKKGDVKPIFGIEAYVCKELVDDRKSFFHLTILARNETGWRNLLKMNTEAQENFYYRPRVTFDSLQRHGKGLVILTGCPSSLFIAYMREGKFIKAQKLYDFYCDCVGEENVYIEIQIHDLGEAQAVEEQFQIHNGIRHFCEKLEEEGLKPKIVLTNDAHFLLPEDNDIFFAIGKINIKGGEQKDVKLYTDIYLKTRKEMFETFKRSKAYQKGIFSVDDFKDWCRTTVDIAQDCNTEITIGKHNLPKFPFNKSKYADEKEMFDAIIHRGIKKKLVKRNLWNKVYRKRLKYEADVIKNAGFVHYFLIIWDIIQSAKKEGIYVGAARGSVAGSLVAYTMNITDVDPIKFNLMFERFLNSTRTTSSEMFEIEFVDGKKIQTEGSSGVIYKDCKRGEVKDLKIGDDIDVW
jgi:DNA polymerase-3 subunit alpha